MDRLCSLGDQNKSRVNHSYHLMEVLFLLEDHNGMEPIELMY